MLLLALSAFFVAAEFALISARRTVIEPLAVNSYRARATLKAMEEVSVMMATAQLGITLCGVLLGALGEPAIAHLLEPLFHSLGVPESWLHPVSLVVALLLVVSAHVALGEMVPKNIALAAPERTAMMLAAPMRALVKAIGPIVRGLNHVANWTVRLLGFHPKDEVASSFNREEVAGLLAESREEGLLDPEDHWLITSALQFDTEAVTSVLVPDTEVVAVPVGVTAAGVERACAHSGFSRFPCRRRTGTTRVTCTSGTSSTSPWPTATSPSPRNASAGCPTCPAPPGCALHWTGCEGPAPTWPGLRPRRPPPRPDHARGRHRVPDRRGPGRHPTPAATQP